MNGKSYSSKEMTFLAYVANFKYFLTLYYPRFSKEITFLAYVTKFKYSLTLYYPCFSKEITFLAYVAKFKYSLTLYYPRFSTKMSGERGNFFLKKHLGGIMKGHHQDTTCIIVRF
jgi:hypothetical protein